MDINKLKDLKEFLSTLTDEQLEQPVFVYPEECRRLQVHGAHVTEEDQWVNKYDNDDWGTLTQIEEARRDAGDYFDPQEYELMISKGTVELFSSFEAELEKTNDYLTESVL